MVAGDEGPDGGVGRGGDGERRKGRERGGEGRRKRRRKEGRATSVRVSVRPPQEEGGEGLMAETPPPHHLRAR